MVILVGEKVTEEQIKLAGGDWKYNLNKGFETQLEKILSLEGGRMIAAERAMTASIILGR